MKKTIALLLMVGMFAIGIVGYVDSTPTSTAYQVKAYIQAGTPDATFNCYKTKSVSGREDVDYDNPKTQMDFDDFSLTTVKTNTTQWITTHQGAIVAWCNGMGRMYYIKSTGTGTFALTTDATKTLPAGSFACKAVYAGADRWVATDPNTAQDTDDIPPGTKNPDAFKALSSAILLYTSENPGSNRIIQARYYFPAYTSSTGGLPYTGYAEIPTTQAPGTYSGVTVQLSITQ